eukprot:scaffold664905_cov53-Prasinocladus_malaysianus.AAC.1
MALSLGRGGPQLQRFAKMHRWIAAAATGRREIMPGGVVLAVAQHAITKHGHRKMKPAQLCCRCSV